MKRFAPIAAATLFASSLLYSQEFHVGASVPDFTLQQLNGSPVQFSALKGNVTVVMFISVQCPVSNAYDDRMNALDRDYSPKGVKFVAINANRTEPADAVADHAHTQLFVHRI